MQNLEEGHHIIDELNGTSSIGEQWAACKEFMATRIDGILPQVVCIMLSGSKISFPIYALLRERAARSLSFRIRLFFTLKSSLATADESFATFCYFLCCDLVDLSISEQKKNIGILYRNYIARHPELFETTDYNNSWFILPKRSYNRRTLPGISRIQNRRLRRTLGAVSPRIKMPSFEGLWIFFARAISSLVSPPLFREFDKYLKIFSSKKNFKNLNVGGNPKSSFGQCIVFYNALVDISSRLKGLPGQLRQRALDVELRLLNMKPSGKIIDPFNPRKRIVNILVDECDTLDSADNVPYMFFAEVVDFNGIIKKNQSTKYCRAGVLWSHLNSLSDLGDVGDVNGIRENILEALEQVLFVPNIAPEQKMSEEKELHDPADVANNNVDNLKVIEADMQKYSEADPEDITNNEGDGVANENESGPSSNSTNPYDPEQALLLFPKLRKWDNLRSRTASTSPLCSMPGWDLTSFIIKSGSSLKLEYLAYQIISEAKRIFIHEGLPIYLKDYQIYLISETSGFVETVRDTLSVHKVKSEHKNLAEYFKASFEDQNSAKRNFLTSLVGYSLISFLLQLKDRHNGNILIDGYGHILHVDFAFILGKHPGFYCVENAPFKFSDDYMDLIDLEEFRQLFYSGFAAISRNIKRISVLVEVIEKQGLCDPGTAVSLRGRMHGGDTKEAIAEHCKILIDRSIRNMRTVVYDRFQYFSNGYC